MMWLTDTVTLLLVAGGLVLFVVTLGQWLSDRQRPT
jgi:hypothetical protein